MNHPGLDKPNSSVAKAIGRPGEDEKEAEEIEQVFQDHRFVHGNPYCKYLTIPLLRANTELEHLKSVFLSKLQH
jgi:hypothetical protein